MNKVTADRIIERAATLALLYYPEIAADDSDYSLASDITWVLDDAPHLSYDAEFRDLVARVIMDPTGTRDLFTTAIYGAVTDR